VSDPDWVDSIFFYTWSYPKKARERQSIKRYAITVLGECIFEDAEERVYGYLIQ